MFPDPMIYYERSNRQDLFRSCLILLHGKEERRMKEIQIAVILLSCGIKLLEVIADE